VSYRDKPEIVKFTTRLRIFIIEHLFLAVLGVLLSTQLSRIGINDHMLMFFLTPFFGIFIFALFFRGRTLLMILYNMEIVKIDTNYTLPLKVLFLRQLLRVIYCIPLFTIFWAMFSGKSPWYDKILGIEMIWAKNQSIPKGLIN